MHWYSQPLLLVLFNLQITCTIKEMTQALNKALKMSSLLKTFNQIPLFMEMYWHDLKFCHFQKIISRLHSWPLRKLKKKKPREARISGELIYEAFEKIMPAWKVKNSNFLVCMISLDRGKRKASHRKNLNNSLLFLARVSLKKPWSDGWCLELQSVGFYKRIIL